MAAAGGGGGLEYAVRGIGIHQEIPCVNGGPGLLALAVITEGGHVNYRVLNGDGLITLDPNTGVITSLDNVKGNVITYTR